MSTRLSGSVVGISSVSEPRFKAVTRGLVSKAVLRNIFIFVGACIFCGTLMSAAFDAQWSIIDDHWAMHYISKIERFGLSFWHVFSLTLDSEVGQFGQVSRYRPSYHFLYVLESFVWGNRPNLWWCARCGVFSLLFSALCWVAARRINIVSSFVFTAWLFLPVYWADIWGRLGPGEIYASLGFALYVVGIAKWYEELRKPDGGAASLWMPCVLVTIGSLIATGSKENFVVLHIPVFILLVWSWVRGRGRVAATLCFVVLGAYSAFIATSILLYLIEHKADVYNRAVTSEGVSTLLVQELLRLWPYAASILVAVGSTCAVGAMVRRVHARSFFDAGATLVALLLLGLSLYVSQVVFYRGVYPTNTRYDFPGSLVLPFCYLAAFVFVRRCLELCGVPRVVDRALVSVATVMLLSVVVRTGYAPLTSKMVFMRDQSAGFGLQLAKTVNKCKKRAQRPILFDSYHISDFERIASIRRFLLANGVRNPMMLRLNYSPSNFLEGSLERKLVEMLGETSRGETLQKNPEKDWGDNYTTFGFSPLSELNFNEKFLVIGFSARPSVPRGTGVGVY